MRHRHLDLPDDAYPVAAVHSILERGGASDIYRLLAELRRDPHGTAASAVERAVATSKVYGYPALLRLCLERFRSEGSSRTGSTSDGRAA